MSEDPGSAHLDLDAASDLEEGLTAPDAAAAARAHLDGCVTCRALVSRVRTTRALLSALPPQPMPDEVVARVDDAVAHAGDLPATTIVPLARRRRIWRSPAVAGGVAAAAVAVLVAALVVGNVTHNHDKAATTSAPAAGGARSTVNPPVTKTWATGKNYTAASIATLVPPLVTGTPPPPGTVFHGAQGAATPATSAPSTSATPAYTQAELRASPEAVLACGRILAGGFATTPVAVDFARFDGKPAVVFALPAIGHAADLDVWVVRSVCSSGSLDLYFQRIPRPG